MKFNDQLHEDLFDLFIMHILWGKPDGVLEYKSFKFSKTIYAFKGAKTLFPQQNHPEEFVRYVSDMGLSNIKKGHAAAVVNEKCFWNKHKIKITVEEE